MTTYGALRQEFVLSPVSGKALPIYKGEVLRITQEAGGQCVDFNCFNLHDYQEAMSVGQMRRQGFRLSKGDYVISIPPRANLMMYIQEMPESCVTDLLGSRCSPDMYEACWGFKKHTNCQDTLAESIREYGLSPDDVHDSFNLWMYTGWDDRGRWTIRRNMGQKGDYVDLLAAMDVLAVPIVCGSGDLYPISNFYLKPLRIQVFEKSSDTDQIVEEKLAIFRSYTHRELKDYRVKTIRTERELTADPNYKPEFVNFPLKMHEIEVELTEDDYRQIQRLKAKGLALNDEDAIRSLVLAWHLKNRFQRSPFEVRP